MTILWHELRRGRVSLLVWSAAIACMMAVCVLIYPDMASQMEKAGAMFAGMGGFSRAFGMDKLNFGEFTGFFAVECGNILGLGGAFFAALTGASALVKEERERTAEFLLTHPVSRTRVIGEKLGAAVLQVLILNLLAAAATALSVFLIGEKPPLDTMALLFWAYLLLQLEVTFITFGISAFLRRGGPGLGLGLAAALYFLNIIANLTEDAGSLKYITPFGYTDSAVLITDGAIPGRYLASGAVLAAAGIAAAFWYWRRKDLS